MKKILIILLVFSLIIVTNPICVSAATGKNATLDTFHKILEQKRWQNGNYSIKGKTGELIPVNIDPDVIYQTLNPGVAYAKLIDFDGNGKEELYLHYLTVSSYDDYLDVYANSEVWSIEKGKAKLAFKEKIQSSGSHISDGQPISFCKVKGKTYLVSQTSFSTGAGDFDSQYFSTLLVREFVNGKIVEKYTLNETWTELNEASEQFNQYGDTTIYEWNVSKNGKIINSGEKINAGEKYHAKEIIKIKDLYKNTEEIISAGSYIELSCKINDVDACLNSMRKKITDSKLRNTLAQKVKNTKPSKVVKCSSTSITIQEMDNFYSDGEGPAMKPRKDKKTYTIDEYTVFTIINDQYVNENVSKSDFKKRSTKGYYAISYKGKRVISISEVYHP